MFGLFLVLILIGSPGLAATIGGGTPGTGTGDVTNVWQCTGGDCSDLTAGPGDRLDAALAATSSPATRSAELPATCSEGQLHQDTDSGGSETYVCTATDTWTKLATPSDNAATATALSANGTNCSGVQVPQGVDAQGNAEGCFSPSGVGTVTAIDASGGVETTSGASITGIGTIRGNMCVNAQTGISYTVTAADRGCVVTFANAGAIAVTLPQAGTAGFDAGFSFHPVNIGAGTVTITPTTSTIQGSATLQLTTDTGVTVASDGANYLYVPGLSGVGGSGDITNVWGCATGDCSTLTAAAGDSLDAGSADASSPATRSTALPGTCTEGQLHQDTNSGGSETYVCTDTNTWTKLLASSDNAATATALAADGTNCSGTDVAQGVDAQGNAQGCFSPAGAGTVTSVDATGGVETVSGSAITGSGTIRSNVCVNAQTGTTYTVLSTDRGCVVTFSNASPVTVTLPEAGSAGFDAGFSFFPVNLGVGLVTIAPTTSTIQGDPDLDLVTGTGVPVASDGTNYVYVPGAASGGGGSQGLSSVMTIDRIYGEATSSGTAMEVGSDAANEYIVTYRDATAGLIQTCKVGGVLDNCDKTIKIGSGKVFRVYNASGGVALEIDASGRTTQVTEYRRVCGGDLVAISPADSLAYHIWNKDPLSTAPTAIAVSGTNRAMGVAQFPDADGDYGVQIRCNLPQGFITTGAQITVWARTTGTATGNAVMQFQTKCYADDEADDAAFNTATAHVMAAGVVGRPNRYQALTLDLTGCAAGELLTLRAFRNRTHGSDTLSGGAWEVEKIELAGYGYAW